MSKYTEIQCVFEVCSGKATAAIEQYRQRYPQQQLPYRRVFTCVDYICEKLVSFRGWKQPCEHKVQREVEEEGNSTVMVQQCPRNCS